MKKEPPWSILLPAMACTVACILAPVLGARFWVAFLPGIILPLSGACAIGRQMALAHASNGWPNTLGKVVSSSIRERIKFRNTPESKATYFEHVVRYQYEANGKTYSGERVTFGPPPTASQQDRSKYKNGSSVTVFYDPNRPSMAVLQPGTPARLLPGLILLLVLATCFTIAVTWLYRLET